MLGGVWVAMARGNLPVQRAYPRRTVGTELFAERDVHAHVQPGIGFAVFRREIPLQPIFTLDVGMIFGMLLDDLGYQLFKGLQRPAGKAFLPAIDEKSSQLFSILPKHQ